MSLSSNALCAKAKAMYGGRLNKNVYLDLTRKQTIGEVVSYLKSQTSYADALKDINIRHVHRGQIEDFLKENCKSGDLLITMGAGDVVKIGEDLLK